MKSRKPLVIALIVIIGVQIISTILVHGDTPVPIGATVQSVPFESNPTSDAITGLTVTNPTNAYDGSLDTYAIFKYTGVTGTFELKGFNITGYQFDTIAWVDFKISYKAVGSTDDQYRIIYYVGATGPVTLQNWVGGSDAQFPPPLETVKQSHRAFSNQSEPTDDVWSWSDIADLRIIFETQTVGAGDAAKSVTVYEVWLTVYSVYPLPLPPEGVSVQPSVIIGLHAGATFFVDLYMVNVTDLWGFEFKLDYDTTVLTALDISLGHEYFAYHPLNNLFTSLVNDTGGYVSMFFHHYFGADWGFTGNTPMVRLYFQVDQDGTSLLSFSKCIITDIPYQIFKPVSDGLFATSPTRNVAVKDVKVSPTQVMPGKNVTIDVSVMNQGTVPETFDVAVYYDSTPTGPSQTVTLNPGLTQSLTFKWNTTGVAVGHYLIKAVASAVPGETNPDDNTLQWAGPGAPWPDKLIVGRHDITVANVTRAFPTPSATIASSARLNVSQGQTVYINVTVYNSGNFTEAFNFTAYYYFHSGPRSGDRLIETVTGLSLGAGANTTRSFAWNTIDVPFGSAFSPKGILIWQNVSECTVKANVTKVPYEEGFDYDYRGDNEFVDGLVNVTRSAPLSQFDVFPSEAYVDQPVKFDAANSRTPQGTSIISYKWGFGDGNITVTTGPVIYHAYASKGSYKANLTVTNDAGFNATFTYPFDLKIYIRDVAVVNVTLSGTQAAIGEFLNISVTVRNKGNKDETSFFDVKVYYGDTLIETKSTTKYLSTYGLTGDNETLVFTWNTTTASLGAHIIKAVAEEIPWELSLENNELTADSPVTLLWHNIHLTSVKASKLEVTVGESVSIDVVVENQGNFTETFAVTLYFNLTEINTQTVTDLAKGTPTTLTFAWDTSGLSPSVYTLRAVASKVSGEIKTDDNSITGDSVSLKEPPTIGIIVYVVAGIVIVLVVAVVLYYFKVRKPSSK